MTGVQTCALPIYSIKDNLEVIYTENLLKYKDREKAFYETLSFPKNYSVSEGGLKKLLISAHVFFLTPLEAKTMLDEFIFIINTFLPRKPSDTYYSFDIMPNPGHWVFFEIAVKKLGLDYRPSATKPKDLTDHAIEGIKKLILKGATLNDIYFGTCATKSMITTAFKSIDHSIRKKDAATEDVWNIELALFGLSRKYRYKRKYTLNDKRYSFVVFENEKPRLAIDYITIKSDDKDPSIFKKYKAVLKRTESKKEICNKNDVLYLPLDNFYCAETKYLSAILLARLSSSTNIADFYKERMRHFRFLSARAATFSSALYLEKAKYCVCLNCAKSFDPKTTHLETYQNRIVCPFCDYLSVITDNQHVEITEDMLLFSDFDDEDFIS